MRTDLEPGGSEPQSPLLERVGPAFFVSVPLWATGAILSVATLIIPAQERGWLFPISLATLVTALILTVWGVLFGEHRAR